jgi:hypothetical protein
MSVIEKNLSVFIEKQFPAFYRDEGPVFVAFVKEYYRWLEERTVAANKKKTGQWISVASQNNVVIGSNTTFTTDIANGSQIAIYRDKEFYEIFTVGSVSNNTYLTLDAAVPSFSNVKTYWTDVALKRNSLYDSRRLLEYTDVDTTLDDFIVHFKEKYLAGIQFDTNTNIRQLLKHTLDLYRAKGTPQALELLFRIVFGADIDLYYPNDDVFRLSDGEWKIPKYIEITLSNIAPDLVNKQLVGVTSGATAFVDRAVRRRVNDRLVDLLYISAVIGSFSTNELIDIAGVNKLNPVDRPIMIGSLSAVTVDLNGVGGDFAIGDIVDVYSALGSGAKARVSATANNSGILSYDLVDGGYGYENGANTQVLVSEKIMFLSNVVVDQVLNPWVNNYTQMFETISQPMADIFYVSANNTFSPNTSVFTYHANNLLKGTGVILSDLASNTTSGTLRVSVVSGNLQATRIYTTSNVMMANQSSYTDRTATGNCIGQTANLSMLVTGIVGTVSNNDVVYQFNSTNTVTATAQVISVVSVGANVTLTVNAYTGIFKSGDPIYANTSTLVGNVAAITVGIGVVSVNGVFLVTDGNIAYTLDSNTAAHISLVSQGSGAGISIANAFNFTETVSINTDYVHDYLNVALNATAYGFPSAPTANIANTVTSGFTNVNITIGKITLLSNVMVGSLFTAAPIIRVIDKQVSAYDRRDYKLDFSSPTGFFTVGEEVTQASTGARGIVRSVSNTTVLTLERMRFNLENDFTATVNSTTVVVGQQSGTTANVNFIVRSAVKPPIGADAEIADALSVSNGSITSITLTESGYGFRDGEPVTIALGNNQTTGFAVCLTSGVGRGYYRRKGGFLSDQKKLYDGYYYQEYSYDIRSSVTLDKYKEMLREIAHVAGTKNFASLVTTSLTDVQLSSDSAVITVS